ncbi:hypothetical protein Sa4125_43560 [Aureimonas sp. SA4125]|uniref:DUF429 domain-containing protein n=1 Tax=Aureimonas sp. SA4125 TaxID=2826993 RepID=UPI001CC4445A|nr:DUF429 domain-containing protein [Aureimonas sp. SA4125]BDA86814.1 hypothetical protein Sa4125_43560 [Aureimonas sp. SA4125]
MSGDVTGSYDAADAAGSGRVIAGVDGCRAGWVAVIGRLGGTDAGPAGDAVGALLPARLEARVFPRFDFLLGALPDDAVLAVDMPIGLPERIEGPGRAAEKATRPLLGARQSSVFSIPARAAVEAGAGPFRSELHRREAYRAACDIAARLSHPPRRISIQGFGLFPKIIEIDRLLRADPRRADRVIESHPELAFRLLNGSEPVASPKKIRGSVDAAGMEERRRLLLAAGLDRGFLYAPAPAGSAQDDFLDACAMLCVAARHVAGIAVAHPAPPDRDAQGLPIAIWA